MSIRPYGKSHNDDYYSLIKFLRDAIHTSVFRWRMLKEMA